MIQFNLLPDIKLEFIKAQRAKNTVVAVAIIASIISLVIFALAFINVNVLQKRHMTNITNEIKENTAELAKTKDIDKILTVQNQLSSLTPLHENKPSSARAAAFISQITPQNASVSSVEIDYSDQKITISGTTDNSVTVNKFVDTIKFTKYTVDSAQAQSEAFSSVVLKNFSARNDKVTYTIEFKYNPEIFNNTKSVALIIPNIISTRSQTQKPGEDLFQAQPNATEGGN